MKFDNKLSNFVFPLLYGLISIKCKDLKRRNLERNNASDIDEL